jgi:NADH:ubiquinone oxidoreductase subunit H
LTSIREAYSLSYEVVGVAAAVTVVIQWGALPVLDEPV